MFTFGSIFGSFWGPCWSISGSFLGSILKRFDNDNGNLLLTWNGKRAFIFLRFFPCLLVLSRLFSLLPASAGRAGGPAGRLWTFLPVSSPFFSRPRKQTHTHTHNNHSNNSGLSTTDTYNVKYASAQCHYYYYYQDNDVRLSNVNFENHII